MIILLILTKLYVCPVDLDGTFMSVEHLISCFFFIKCILKSKIISVSSKMLAQVSPSLQKKSTIGDDLGL